MAGPYAYMTDEQLTQELTDYRAALKTFAMGGSLKVIAGEGRRKEMSVGDIATLRAEYREILAEYNRRPTLGNCSNGGSLGIDFGHGGGPGYDYGSVVITDV